MPLIDPVYQAQQRKRWMRPNAHLFIRPDRRRFVRPVHQDDHPFAEYERKYSPNQPRVPVGSGRTAETEMVAIPRIPMEMRPAKRKSLARRAEREAMDITMFLEQKYEIAVYQAKQQRSLTKQRPGRCMIRKATGLINIIVPITTQLEKPSIAI